MSGSEILQNTNVLVVFRNSSVYQFEHPESDSRQWQSILKKKSIQYCEENRHDEVKACLTLKVDVNTVSEDGL